MTSQRKIVKIPDQCERIVLCGGPYSNFGAVERFLEETAKDAHRFCLGDIGGFGPLPNRTLDLIRASNMICIRGNYDEAVGTGMNDCGCGYIDALDRKFAQISFDYTLENTSAHHRAWLKELPEQITLEWRGQRILLCHGSPEQVNDFVWDSETSSERIATWLEECDVQGICCTHSGLPWIREVKGTGFWCNVGVLGRPAHDGTQEVYYSVVDFPRAASKPRPRLVPLSYDPTPVVEAMLREGLPEEFSRALLEGVWTTCFKIMPPEEQKVRSRAS